MKIATARLRSISPYSQSRYVQDARKEGESYIDYEERTWRKRLHANPDGTVFIPPMSFKNCIAEAAKFMGINLPGKGKANFTKHFEAGVLVTEALHLPVKADEVPGEWLFVPADGKRGGSKRVSKCFPIIHEWEGDMVFHIIDETVAQTITVNGEKVNAFEYHLEKAGEFIGVGRFRPRNNGFYGRYAVKKVTWN